MPWCTRGFQSGPWFGLPCCRGTPESHVDIPTRRMYLQFSISDVFITIKLFPFLRHYLIIHSCKNIHIYIAEDIYSSVSIGVFIQWKNIQIIFIQCKNNKNIHVHSYSYVCPQRYQLLILVPLTEIISVKQSWFKINQ